MRILHLIPTLTGAGAERRLASLCQLLREQGHEVMVGHVSHGRGVWPDSVPVHRFGAERPWDPRLIVEIALLIRRWRADVVHTWLPRMDVAGGIAAAMSGVPLVVQEANSGPSYAAGAKTRLRTAVVRRAAAVVAANSDAGARYWSRVAPRLRTVVIPNAVAAAAIAATEPAARPPHQYTAIYAGRLEPEKRVDVFIRACAAVIERRDLFVRICGDGRDRGRLEALASELGIAARVDFSGFTTDVWRYLRAADVFALLSDFEGEPNALLEAFAAGVPAIVSDIEAHEPFADVALVVQRGDVADTARAIDAVLTGGADVADRAAAARRLAASRLHAVQAEQYLDLYAAVARSRSVPAHA